MQIVQLQGIGVVMGFSFLGPFSKMIRVGFGINAFQSVSSLASLYVDIYTHTHTHTHKQTLNVSGGEFGESETRVEKAPFNPVLNKSRSDNHQVPTEHVSQHYRSTC